MRTDYISADLLDRLLDALMPENRAVMTIAARTGLRVGDVLRLRWRQVEPVAPGRVVRLTECKTGKTKEFILDSEMCYQLTLMAQRCGASEYVFPGRSDIRRIRTRQAVWRDLKRAARLYRLDGKKIAENVGPHSARKGYAVQLYRETGDMAAVQRALNHSDSAVTMLYAMADKLTELRLGK